MKKLIFRKFTVDVLTFFLTSILIMGLIVWTLQAVNYFDFVTRDGHGLKIYFFYTLLNFPKIIYRILPFMFFISLFFTIIRYEMNNELNIFWTNGINKIEFINTVIKLSIILMFIQIFIAAYLAPISQYKARDIIRNSNVDFLTNLINEGKFINAVSGLTIFIEKKEQGEFSNIFIDDSSKGFSRITYARTGKLLNNDENKEFLLFDGKVINIDDNRTNTFKFNQINFGLDSYASNSIIKPKIQETDSKSLLNCVFDKKDKPTQNCKNNDSLDEVKQELSKRFLKPTYIPLVALMCCFLFFSGKYDKRYNKLKIYIFLLVLIILIISETSLRYSGTSNILLILNFSLPFILFLTFYLYSYFKINNA